MYSDSLYLRTCVWKGLLLLGAICLWDVKHRVRSLIIITIECIANCFPKDPEALKLKKNLLETKKTLEAKQRIESNRDVRISNTALNKQEEVAPKARLQKAIPKAIEPKEFEVLLKEASTATQIKNINVKKGGQKRGPKKKLSVPGPVATAVARKKPGPKPGHKRRKVLPPKRFLESDVIEEDYIPVVSVLSFFLPNSFNKLSNQFYIDWNHQSC